MRNYGDFRHTCIPHHNYMLITGNTLRHRDSLHFLWGKHLQCVFCLQVTYLQSLLCSGISPLALFIVQGIRLDKEKCWLSLKLILGLLNRLLSIGGQMTLKFERSCCFYKGNKSTCSPLWIWHFHTFRRKNIHWVLKKLFVMFDRFWLYL